jgi:predicted RNase H-like HicB family nuclease
MKLTAVFVKLPGGYVAFMEELPGANTRGKTLKQARSDLHEALALVLDTLTARSP